MRISEIRIENFGKLRNVQFAPGPGMNLVYAPNEGGKSTLHAFIRGMFFGMARMRGRAARTDTYSRYEPWENPEIYGGRMRLECGGKQFRLSRSFSREHARSELVCETDGERLSVEDGDLEMLLGEVSEVVYDNTVSIGQLKGLTDRDLLSELRNYISGCQEGMDAGLDLGKAREQLRGKEREFLRQIRQESEKQAQRQKILEEKIREHQKVCQQLLGERVPMGEKEEKTEAESLQEARRGSKKQSLFFFLIAALLSGVCVLAEAPVWTAALLLLLGGVGAWAWIWFGKSRMEEQNIRVKIEQRMQSEKIRWQAQSLEERIREEESLLENLRSEYEQSRQESAQEHPLQTEIRALELARQTIEELSGQMQKAMGRMLQKRVSEIFCGLTRESIVKSNWTRRCAWGFTRRNATFRGKSEPWNSGTDLFRVSYGSGGTSVP